jgi:hypothetical protein
LSRASRQTSVPTSSAMQAISSHPENALGVAARHYRQPRSISSLNPAHIE